MQTSVLFKASGRSSKSPIVILTGLSIHDKAPSAFESLALAASQVRRSLRSISPRRILRAIFSEKATAAVGISLVAALWINNIGIDDPVKAGEAAATDCLLALPWGIAWAYRYLRAGYSEKGGEA